MLVSVCIVVGSNALVSAVGNDVPAEMDGNVGFVMVAVVPVSGGKRLSESVVGIVIRPDVLESKD